MSTLSAVSNFTVPPIQHPKPSQPPVVRGGDRDGAGPDITDIALQRTPAKGVNLLV